MRASMTSKTEVDNYLSKYAPATCQMRAGGKYGEPGPRQPMVTYVDIYRIKYPLPERELHVFCNGLTRENDPVLWETSCKLCSFCVNGLIK